MKRPPKIEFIPVNTIVSMNFQELKDNGLIKKSALKNHAEILLKRLPFKVLRDLNIINETRLNYNMIKEYICINVAFGNSIKVAKLWAAEEFHLSPKSISHILYRKIKK
jgi:hypothetical protein